MTQTVALIDSVLDQDSWDVRETDDIRDLLVEVYGKAPQGLTIYHLQIADNCDVSPFDEDDWNALAELPGPFYVLEEARDPISIILLAIVTIASLVLSFVLRPSTPNANVGSTSGTNALSDRQNTARPLKRIEDGAGTFRSTPSLVMYPYKIFSDQLQEIEYCYMCVGVGTYAFPGAVPDIREDQTLVSQITGQSVEFFGPNTSPLTGDAPQLRIGNPITEPLVTIKPCASINGQTLFAPNYKRVQGAGNEIFQLRAGNVGAIWTSDNTTGWHNFFSVGDVLNITGATFNKDGQSGDLSGNGYVVSGFTTTPWLTWGQVATLLLQNVDTVTSDWDKLNSVSGKYVGPNSALIEAADVVALVGPFAVTVPDMTQLWINVVAEQGLYGVDSKNNKLNESVTFEVDVQQLADDGVTPIGDWVSYMFTISGSTTIRSFIGWTLRIAPPFSGNCQVQMQRTTKENFGFDGTIVDEIKWRDLYAVSPVSVNSFGDVTTLHTQTPATPAALGVQTRKLNALVTRCVPQKQDDGTFTTELFPSNSIDDIFCFFALDPYNGGRQLSELNVDQIYDTVAAVKSYFGTDEAAEFGYTFDDDTMTFEDIGNTIAQAGFCLPTRVGSLLEFTFEAPTNDSTLLFNHRNKLPGSEQRSATFGFMNNTDGVEVSWVDGTNYDAPQVFRLPTDGSATKPLKVSTLGIRNYSQAYWRGWREWNKINYQHVVTQFTGLSEAGTLAVLERILVADNVRPQTQDGEVVSQDGLQLTLSQNFVAAVGKDYVIFLQIPDGSTDSIPIVAGSAPNLVILDRPPVSPLALGDDLFRRATYWIVSTDDGREQAFLVSDKEPNDSFTYKVTATNYDARFYQNDTDTPHGNFIDVDQQIITDDQGNKFTFT